ncbi:MAG TPA: L-histidine N(alpha)-methyltransferase [Acidobacteriaceae bacterium]|jgi:dimethylhistidine N-methyltransferase|nr:L-histidine N(alpha)-methyltransferase [Acidobacteriaceae bacterium]
MHVLSSIPCLPEAASTPLGAEIYRGLTAFPKRLSPWLFYDQRGSELFEAITELPEYYVTRTERGIFAQHADAIVEAAGERRLAILELGAGTAAKTGLLLAATVRKQDKVAYFPIDISASALQFAHERIGAETPGVSVNPILGDYTRELEELPMPACRRLVLYIGSSIGNFDPPEATTLLRRLRRRLAPGDWLLLGVDHVKDRATLLRAYNDTAGVTADFNRNMLERIKRELGGNLRPGLFRHRAWWNDQVARIEMHLESLVAQEISIPALDLTVSFRRGETIHTENSYKFTPETAATLLERGGFAVRQSWTDEKRWFGVYLAEAM